MMARKKKITTHGLGPELLRLIKDTQEIEPGQLIIEISCPCCGAELVVEHGDDEGEISVIGDSLWHKH